MKAPFFPDDVTFLAEYLDDHLEELQETLRSIQDLCKKDERFAILSLKVVEDLQEAISLVDKSSLNLVDAGMAYFAGEIDE
ncbi:MAG: hypothetical protein [Caudoviricetes sp.]|nr:MAG: hypothetical protein [Caudoviricetes sp.]